MPPLYRLAGLASGSFLFCTRSAFEVVGGFDERRYASEEVWLSLALRKQGRFVILREHVITSGRKLRGYSLRETFLGADRRQFIYPWLSLFELSRNAEQHVFPSVRRHEMHANRQAVFTPV